MTELLSYICTLIDTVSATDEQGTSYGLMRAVRISKYNCRIRLKCLILKIRNIPIKMPERKLKRVH